MDILFNIFLGFFKPKFLISEVPELLSKEFTSSLINAQFRNKSIDQLSKSIDWISIRYTPLPKGISELTIINWKIKLTKTI